SFLILATAVLALYARTAQFTFTAWDDVDTVARNPRLVSGLAGLKVIWTQDQMELYVPLTYTVWWTMARFVSLDAGAFHLLNVGLHVANCWLVYVVLRQLFAASAARGQPIGRGWVGCLLGALVFAMHPLQSEAVAWISGAKDLLAAEFCL